MNSGGYLPTLKWINYCAGIYHTGWMKNEPKINFIFVKYSDEFQISHAGYSEVNSTCQWINTSQLANQRRGELYSPVWSILTLVISLDFQSTKRVLWLVDSCSHTPDKIQMHPKWDSIVQWLPVLGLPSAHAQVSFKDLITFHPEGLV